MKAELPDDLQLVCACLGPDGRQLPASGEPDPDRVAGIARRHQVSGRVLTRLQQAGRPIATRLIRRVERDRQAGLRQLAAALALRDAFAAKGIDALFLKGLPLSQRAFGSPLARWAADIDVLVPADQVRAAWLALEQLGYTREVPAAELSPARLRLFQRISKDSLHRDPAAGVIVELHWRLTDHQGDARAVPLTERQTVAVTDGQGLPTLADIPLWLYLVEHGAAHAWARLKWLDDVAALIGSADDRGAAYWQAACRRGSDVAAASAIILCERLFGLAPPPGFAAPASLRLTLLLRLAMASITAGEGMEDLADSPRRGWTELSAKLLAARGWGGIAGGLRRMVWSADDVATVDLPPSLFWLYPLLRLPLLVRRRLVRAKGRGVVARHGGRG